ncbi:hypothetical protein AB1286_24705 [Trinickia sp. NRRL B-1857]|uniref:hypothetical protein n=1 Tax=Trinickia sp. NRRL B-1857 TaxID=3162879 RepID=UPI003D2A9946
MTRTPYAGSADALAENGHKLANEVFSRAWALVSMGFYSITEMEKHHAEFTGYDAGA